MKVILGAANTTQDGWISTDQSQLDITNPVSWGNYFGGRETTNLLAEHVLEHLTPHDARRAVGFAHRYLTPGGRFRIAVPDAFHPGAWYIEHNMPGGTGPGAEDHKSMWSYRTLGKMLEGAGFKIDTIEWWDEDHFPHCSPNPLWSILGHISRSLMNDHRNREYVKRLYIPYAQCYTSLIVDAIKP